MIGFYDISRCFLFCNTLHKFLRRLFCLFCLFSIRTYYWEMVLHLPLNSVYWKNCYHGCGSVYWKNGMALYLTFAAYCSSIARILLLLLLWFATYGLVLCFLPDLGYTHLCLGYCPILGVAQIVIWMYSSVPDKRYAY